MKKHGITMRTPSRLLAMACLTALVFSATFAAAGERAGSTGGARVEAKPKGAAMKVNATVAPPAILAVRFHHDMCPYCKKLGPQFSKLMRRNDTKSVLFITLNLSNESTQQQAALMLGALGLDHVWTGDLSRIGTVLFVDGKSKEVISTFRADGSKQIKTALREAVQLQND